jgi:hypothetical protein
MNTFLNIHCEKDASARKLMLGAAKSIDVDFRINLRGLNQIRDAKSSAELKKFLVRANVDFRKNIIPS